MYQYRQRRIRKAGSKVGLVVGLVVLADLRSSCCSRWLLDLYEAETLCFTADNEQSNEASGEYGGGGESILVNARTRVFERSAD